MRNGLIVDEFGIKRWYKNDLRHNENGPAVEWTNGYKAWYINGKIHRLDGPAEEYSDGDKYWWYQDQYINCNSQEEFEIYIKRLILL